MKAKTINFALLTICVLLLGYIFICKCGNKLDADKAIATYENSFHAISIAESKELYTNYANRFLEPIRNIQKGVPCMVDDVDPEPIEKDSKVLDEKELHELNQAKLNKKSFNTGIANNLKSENLKKKGNFKSVEAKLDNREDYNPTEYVWVSLAWLEEYLNFAKALEQKNPLNDITGIAINFGAYGLEEDNNIHLKENEKFRGNEPAKSGDHRGRLTNFLTLTYYDDSNDSIARDEIEKHIPFSIQHEAGEDPYVGTFVPLRSVYNNTASNSKWKVENENQLATVLPLLKPKATKKKRVMMEHTSVSANEFNDMPPKKIQ
ncbi:hypothetical protein [Lacinutrix himadriensis]|uniref:hypothetical protein n=1 Tax=Lacinutrix himadriensis TaxID=641549 RepID=UPI0006E3D6F8|nr:hypothetical protein [Lacinutrix himadriensis]